MNSNLIIQLLRLAWIANIFFASFFIVMYLKNHVGKQIDNISQRLFIKQQGIKLSKEQKMDSLKNLGFYIFDYILMLGLVGTTFYYYWIYTVFGLKVWYFAIGIYIIYFIINYWYKKRKEKKEESD